MDKRKELFESIKDYLLDEANRKADGRIETETELATRLTPPDIKSVRHLVLSSKWECLNEPLAEEVC